MTSWKTWARRATIAVGVLVVLAGATAATGVWLAERKLHRRIDVAVKGVELRDDAASRERGRYLYLSRGCVDCHAKDGGGRVFVDDGKGMRIAGPHISPGPGSVVANYSARDWERAIRHGLAPGGRPLLVMPSEDYNRFTDTDLASLVSWVRSMPPAAGGPAVLELPLPVKIAYGFGLMQDAAAKIDHAQPVAQPVPEGVTRAHGAYVANMCLGCHGPSLAGGKIPGAPPDWPAAADLRPGGAMTRYPDADSFIRLFRTGQRPDGSTVRVMPFESLREMSETDLRALHLFLKGESIAAR